MGHLIRNLRYDVCRGECRCWSSLESNSNHPVRCWDSGQSHYYPYYYHCNETRSRREKNGSQLRLRQFFVEAWWQQVDWLNYPYNCMTDACEFLRSMRRPYCMIQPYILRCHFQWPFREKEKNLERFEEFLHQREEWILARGRNNGMHHCPTSNSMVK